MEDYDEDVAMDQGTEHVIAMARKSGVVTGTQSRLFVSESIAQSQGDVEDDLPQFPKLSALQANGNRSEYRRVRCPAHRYTSLREHWEQLLTPLVDYLKLQVSSRSS